MMVICDFDGTTAVNDVGNLLFRTFADGRCFDIIREWKQGRINSRECLEQECEIATVSRAELETFADQQKLDPAFPKFVEFCNQRGIQVEIASDGLDFYIQRILANHDLDVRVAAKANVLCFESGNRIRAEFPYFEKGCGHCGNCKGHHVLAAKQKHDRVIYIGDGLSDRCGAKEADTVFAKRGRDLIAYCETNAIPYHPYDDFCEILTSYRTVFA